MQVLCLIDMIQRDVAPSVQACCYTPLPSPRDTPYPYLATPQTTYPLTMVLPSVQAAGLASKEADLAFLQQARSPAISPSHDIPRAPRALPRTPLASLR